MKCECCGSGEIAYSCHCMVVAHEVVNILGVPQIIEQPVGAREVGLCEKCLKKQRKDKYGHLVPTMMHGLAVLGIMLGIGIACIGSMNSANGGGSLPLKIIGGVIFVATAISALVYEYIVVPAKVRETPYRIFGYLNDDTNELRQEGTHEILVPVGDGFYKDEKEFALCNGMLSTEYRKQLYDRFVVSGEWKMLGFRSETESTPYDRDAGLLTECVNQLLSLYDRAPEGFMRADADEVRAVGEKLDEAGGIRLMREAYGLFREQKPELARNLEIVWGGIGGWRA